MKLAADQPEHFVKVRSREAEAAPQVKKSPAIQQDREHFVSKKIGINFIFNLSTDIRVSV